MQRQVDIFGLVLAGDVAQLEQRSPIVARLAPHVGEARASGVPTMCSIIDLERSSDSGAVIDMPAVAQDGGAVGDAGDLVHAVRDVDDRDAPRPSACAGRSNSRSTSCTDSAVGRLVEHQDLGVLRDRLDDLGQLPLARPEIADQRVGSTSTSSDVEELPGRVARRSGRRSGRSRSWPRGSRKTFCATVRVGIRLISWKIMAMPARRAASAVKLGQRHAVDHDRARRRRLDAVQDLQDRRLAGAVVAEQGVDLARANVEMRHRRGRGRRRNAC